MRSCDKFSETNQPRSMPRFQYASCSLEVHIARGMFFISRFQGALTPLQPCQNGQGKKQELFPQTPLYGDPASYVSFSGYQPTDT
jgi:hypothetical protein